MKPTVGRIVHFVLDSGEHRPAMIVRVWGEGTPYVSSVQLQVFTDSDAEAKYNDKLPPVMWRTSVTEDATAERKGSWHWPEREEV